MSLRWMVLRPRQTPPPIGVGLPKRRWEKDTVTGHWEMMGVRTDVPFPTYPDGFPPEIIAAFEAYLGRGVLGNRAASGTEIIKALGEEHVRTGKPIVYTSADSVFQVAAHEDPAVFGLDRLREACLWAREFLTPPHHVRARDCPPLCR